MGTTKAEQRVYLRLFSILFAHGDPLAPERIAEALEIPLESVNAAVEGLEEWIAKREIPLSLLRLDGRLQLATMPEYAGDILRTMDQRRNAPLSQAALEVLAVVAYNQPVTRSFVEQVRGVDSSGIIVSLQDKGLLEEAGRLALPGRPLVYQVTDQFLRCFGMRDLTELPELPLEAPPETVLEGQVSLEELTEA